jgi:hypothetical protein
MEDFDLPDYLIGLNLINKVACEVEENSTKIKLVVVRPASAYAMYQVYYDNSKLIWLGFDWCSHAEFMAALLKAMVI